MKIDKLVWEAVFGPDQTQLNQQEKKNQARSTKD